MRSIDFQRACVFCLHTCSEALCSLLKERVLCFSGDSRWVTANFLAGEQTHHIKCGSVHVLIKKYLFNDYATECILLTKWNPLLGHFITKWKKPSIL